MIPASIRVQHISPQRVKVTITDERPASDPGQETLANIPPAEPKARVLISFCCDPLRLAEKLLAYAGTAEKIMAEVHEEE